jgi:hypothetical protein
VFQALCKNCGPLAGAGSAAWCCLSQFSAYFFQDHDTHRMFDHMRTGLTDDPKHWRNRAHEARIRASELNDPEAKRQMLGSARGYDRLAERAEGRADAAASRAFALLGTEFKGVVPTSG